MTDVLILLIVLYYVWAAYFRFELNPRTVTCSPPNAGIEVDAAYNVIAKNGTLYGYGNDEWDGLKWPT